MPERSDPPMPSLMILRPPYRELEPVEDEESLLASEAPTRGAAVVWHLARGDWADDYRAVRNRPPGLALVMILPPADSLEAVTELLEATEICRPHSILPYHAHPSTEDLTAVLRRPPEDLGIEVMDYLSWRGIRVDMDTRRLVRRTVELSAELRTVTALARALYMSRRALGRRFLKRGLPVPSHCLHFFRILRACLELQNTDRSLFDIARGLGYPDGFALSNQMMRLTGVRPSAARSHLGWEWIVECWLHKEVAEGKLEIALAARPPRRSRQESLSLRSSAPDGSGPIWRRSNRSPEARASS